jgi:hypothetical protein
MQPIAAGVMARHFPDVWQDKPCFQFAFFFNSIGKQFVRFQHFGGKVKKQRWRRKSIRTPLGLRRCRQYYVLSFIWG